VVYIILLIALVIKRVGVAQSVWRLGYELDDWGSIPGRGKDEIFSLPSCPDQHWEPPSLLSNGYHGILPQDKATRA
jgi:hypothetical protein